MARAFKPCLFDGCNGNAAAPGSGRGYCPKHYLRLRRHGNPSVSLLQRENRPERCTVDGCDRPNRARGFCTMHYTRWKKHGNPNTLSPKHREVQRWMEEHRSYSSDECLIWPFHRNDTGRGTVGRNGKTTSAPNEMCRLAHGEPPSDRHEAAHSCGNGHLGCVNPKHLRWATRSENRMDMEDHGTLPRGTKVNTAKLTENEVRRIRSLDGVEHRKRTAVRFGVSYWTVWEIQTRRSWAWLD